MPETTRNDSREPRAAPRPRFFARPPLPLVANPLDVLPAAINHLLAAEPWARAQLAPHVGKTLDVVVFPFTIRLTVAFDGTVTRAATDAAADTAITVPPAALPRVLALGGQAAMRDARVTGDAEFAQAVSTLATNLRWDVEEDLSKVVGDVAAHRVVGAARTVHRGLARTGERAASNVTEYLLEENPQLVRPHAVARFAEGVRTLRDAVDRLEKRIDRLAGPPARR